jgi:hypothetical protein
VLHEALAALHRARATVYVVSLAAVVLEEIKPRAYNSLSWYEMLDPRKRALIQKLRAYASRMKAGEIALNRFVEETGGALWNPPTFDDLMKINYRVLEEIGTEYLIAYSSDRKPDDKEFHLVRVFPTSRNLVVRARRGVYANQEIR